MDINKINKDRQQKRRSPVDLGTMVYGKVPPQAKDLEQAILGAITLDTSSFDTAAAILKPESFYVEAHQKIFSAMRRLAAKSQPMDILMVQEELRASEELEMVGGPYYIASLQNHVVSSANISFHCKIVSQKFIQREIIRVCGELIGEAYDDGADALELLDYAGEELSKVTDSFVFGDMVLIDNVLVKAIQQIEVWRKMDVDKMGGIAITGVPSGFKQIDIATRGWQAGDLVIIAARPSVGKTAFVLNIIKRAADWMKENGGGSIAMWSLEMKSVRLVLRMLAAASNIWLSKIQTGRLSDHDMKELYSKGIQYLSRLNIFFDDNPGLTFQKLRSKARRLKRKNKLGLIVVDYLQLMSSDTHKGNREQEISGISRNLKNLAQELEVPIIALSQLNREVEKRTNGRPILADLRESGSIEQDADVVMFLYNPPESELEKAKAEGNLELLSTKYATISKQRDGMLITADLKFDQDIQLFETIHRVGFVPVKIPRDYNEAQKLQVDIGSRFGNEGDEDPF